MSCCGIYDPSEPLEVSLFPGECLESARLKYNDQGFVIHSGVNGGFGIKLSMDINNNKLEHEILSKEKSGHVNTYRYCPNDKVFNPFGEDSNDVKESYYSLVNSIAGIDRWYQLTTVFSDGTFSLKANKTFAGIEAGEELSGLAYISEIRFAVTSPFPVDPPECMNPLWRNFEIMIPLDNREIVTENVIMHLEIPVKVGMLLHTLQDRTSDPEAPMQYRDEVLTCDFTIPKNLK